VTATKRRYRQYVICRECKQKKRHEGHGYCRGCHVRWDAAGRPASGPPPAIPPQESGMRGALHLVDAKNSRLEDYTDLESWGADYKEASIRLGVSPSTVFRYRRALRDGASVQLRIRADFEQKQAS
jgi:hypothetical protein